MKKVGRKFLVSVMGLSLMLSAGATGALASENVTNTQNQLPPSIHKSEKNVLPADARGDFVQDTLSHAFYQVGQGKKNVMVFNLNQRYTHNLQGIQTFYTVYYGSIPYGVWVFTDGEFWNKGDGGWINWGFQGSFDRDGGHVKFHRIS
ncbi:hypothetical protein [Brevibacillus laterosporus]|uniref:hypothetical protein n=1 Tax=Brevibacillus laterosporus TaxID=1465 RepID=UPI0026505330|nr:hypothetical protein [Brevibacillus laterosporus]MDN9011468.1 hypothetical protein [Brevibacillus laterosporus]MDO0942899.1 hypothetical protein [Brevibacillus laterosporus]